MFINPKYAIERGWIKGQISENQIQPNAIDFTLDQVWEVNMATPFVISEGGKLMRDRREILPVPARDGSGEFWTLYIGGFDCTSNLYVDLPEGVAASLIIRSTFNRNGLFITSGLYDSGYKGHIGFMLHNRLGEAKIGKGTRVGQILFVKSDSAGLYSGGWNHEQGKHYSEKAAEDIFPE